MAGLGAAAISSFNSLCACLSLSTSSLRPWFSSLRFSKAVSMVSSFFSSLETFSQHYSCAVV